MIHSLDEMKGRVVVAPDGEIGTIADLYFDQDGWTLRYLLVDTGEWLEGRRVLISPDALQDAGEDDDLVWVNVTREQVAQSPNVDLERPLTREDEGLLRGYYGWPLYWGGMSPLITSGVPDFPAVPVTGPDGEPRVTDNQPRFDQGSEPVQREPGLQSFSEVQGYRINANDGHVGTLTDLLVDDSSGRVLYMVVDTGNLFAGRKVLLAPAWVEHISWAEKEVDVDLKSDSIRESPEYDPDQPFGTDEEDRLYRHYGKKRE